MKAPSEDPTKKQLIKELMKLRARISELEQSEEDKKKNQEELKKALDELGQQMLARTSELSVYTEELLAEIEERKQVEAELEQSRRNLEEQVEKRTAELTAANKELEAFSYSVSHDLRAPLRHMSGFVKLLKERLAGYPDEKAHKHITAIAGAADRMGMLIDDLLAFSQIGRGQIQRRKISLNILLKEVVQEFQKDLTDRKISWEIEELPEVLGDRSLLRLVLVNLVSNAVKYTSTAGSPAVIKIGCKEEGSEIICSVGDNGAGFDMKYAGKLFSVFQRLHAQEEFEGTGIGLANVQRIISRHGGRVWAKGSVGQGASFYFTLPNIKEGQ